MPDFSTQIFFVERVINVWNSLPKNVDFSSLSKFKKSVSHWHTGVLKWIGISQF